MGDVIQLRDAIHFSNVDRRQEFNVKRASYRKRAIDLCTSTDAKTMQECVERLSDVLQWKAEDIEVLTRRGVMRYRLRQLGEAKADLDTAVKVSTEISLVQTANLDSLRYRCAVLYEIRDFDAAFLDIDLIMKETQEDPLTLSMRATIRAGKGDFDGAQDDLEAVNKALESGGGSQRCVGHTTNVVDIVLLNQMTQLAGRRESRSRSDSKGMGA